MPAAQHFATAILVLALSVRTASFGFSAAPATTRNRHAPMKKQRQSSTSLHAMGPVARAKKMLDPDDYNRIVEQKMEQDGLTRRQAEDEYNQFLENPSFYYALDKKEEYYKSKGYRNMFEGMIGEAEKEGRGDEVRERIANFQRKNKIKAFSVLAVVVGSFLYARGVYLDDPGAFLPGI
mmetsp:Transcript_29605/g.65207  ORF Transcript_29605/g.65207 Transcript_29605/m.65207 type:complete len:179 (+) Transcript_29605:179-715(+)|eukprot:CAMPEP_0178481272 /NCGR_PEP_ID=MMETSP0696-20121128/6125_1 /TAXON_ID=265572 /ORGANISM="Extubocellulus spinifer, Strain CCMP396" /LENGTH=178 /DNA_ID=CAMNT_0020108737 /DNA_START=119 /DNA_END=655 /DNA_ORIENTATION=-